MIYLVLMVLQLAVFYPIIISCIPPLIGIIRGSDARSILFWFFFVAGMISIAIFYVQRCLELRRGLTVVEREEFTTTPMQHIVLVCAYKEPFDVLQRTLTSLTIQEGIPNKPIVVLAMECKDSGRHAMFARLKEQFEHHFQEFIMTEHLLGPNEVAGKASNENHAVREVYRLMVDDRCLDPFQILVTVADADSIFAPVYLNRVQDTFYSVHDGRRLIYNGPLNVYRNLADTNIAIGTFEMGRAHYDAFKSHWSTYTPQSNYSLTLGFAAEIDFWTPDNISEDQQTRIKAMINNYSSQTTVFVPSYICNDLVEDWGDRYTQAKRHQWGSVESLGYLFALWPCMELRAWLFLAAYESKYGGFGGLCASWAGYVSTAVLIYVIWQVEQAHFLYGVMLVPVAWSWICFWLAEGYIWNYVLAQFPIKTISPCRWIFMVALSPFTFLMGMLLFRDVATLHCFVRAMFYDDLVYVNAPKGTEEERARIAERGD